MRSSSPSIGSYAFFAVNAATSEAKGGPNRKVLTTTSPILTQAIRLRTRLAPFRAPVMGHLSLLQTRKYGMNIDGYMAFAERKRDERSIYVPWKRRSRQTYFRRQAVHVGCTSLCEGHHCCSKKPRKEKMKMLGLEETRVQLPISAKESVDSKILSEAYPLLKEAARFTLMVTDSKKGTRQLPYSRVVRRRGLRLSIAKYWAPNNHRRLLAVRRPS